MMMKVHESNHLLRLYEDLLEMSQRQTKALMEDHIEDLPKIFSEREKCLSNIQRVFNEKSIQYSEPVVSRIQSHIQEILATDRRCKVKLEEKRKEVLNRLKNVGQGQRMLKAYKSQQICFPKFIETRK